MYMTQGLTKNVKLLGSSSTLSLTDIIAVAADLYTEEAIPPANLIQGFISWIWCLSSLMLDLVLFWGFFQVPFCLKASFSYSNNKFNVE